MKLIYTTHAKRRMEQRRVSEKEVRWVLTEPDEIEAYNGEAMVTRRSAERILKVVYYQMSDDEYRIITVIAQRMRSRRR
ncbi:MAG: DUF4258 domain-containing protein [Chloroflexota bacterium]|nr:DUF4258 domain-containing protein [Chloroflexota bacterium]